MENTLPFTFERSIWREAARLKREHPELLEAKTEERRRRRETSANGSKAPEQRLSGFRV